MHSGRFLRYWHSHQSKILLSGILVFAFISRVWLLWQPAQYYFDEQYHVPAAKLILENNPAAFEWWHNFSDVNYPLKNDPDAINESNFDWLHPPLAKYFQAVSMRMFGVNVWGWRVPSVVFGVLVVAMVYGISKELFQNEQLSLLASFMSAMSGLLLVQSRIAMNDIFVTFWMGMCFYFYLKARPITSRKSHPATKDSQYLLLSGVFLGLAMATKWSGVFLFGYVIFYELSYFLRRKNVQILKKIPWSIFCFALLPLILYCSAYVPMFFQGKSLSYFFSLHQAIIDFQWNLAPPHAYESRPWQWFINFRPVWYWRGSMPPFSASIYALENPVFTLGSIGSVFLSLLWLLKRFFHQTYSKFHHPLIHLLLMYGVVWLPWIFSPRTVFLYHYTPAIPYLAILIGYWLVKLWKTHKKIVLFFLIFSGMVFGVYYPHWVGFPVSQNFSEKVYFPVSSWR